MSSKNDILERIKSKTALGNSKRRFKHIACDLLHATGEKPSTISKGTFLSPQTIERVMDCPDEYRPQSETLERIFNYCNAQASFEFVKIKPQFQNQPKPESTKEPS